MGAFHEKEMPSPVLPVKRVPSKAKHYSLALFALAACMAWSMGAWESVLERATVRPRLRPVLLLLGDSLTEKGTIPKSTGWVTLLQNEYQRPATVIPRGLSGYNTRWYLNYGIPIIQGEISSGAYMPAFVTIWLGANDAALPNGSSPAQHVPVESYKQNLTTIVQSVKTMAPDTSILLITPPYVDDFVQDKRSQRYKGRKVWLATPMLWPQFTPKRALRQPPT
ncbi:unnamed protein product [Phytophthora lilii]|uniref:Unnamed protein product n=1 Tax=Phytophthora lilii TaxID=2077276 RepID=A0A9W6YHM5_9STRA|nr:unnamed protein product [Phytophthora lilii]